MSEWFTWIYHSLKRSIWGEAVATDPNADTCKYVAQQQVNQSRLKHQLAECEDAEEKMEIESELREVEMSIRLYLKIYPELENKTK
jgi:hypothetical protein